MHKNLVIFIKIILINNLISNSYARNLFYSLTIDMYKNNPTVVNFCNSSRMEKLYMLINKYLIK